jgi:hypothetical protein
VDPCHAQDYHPEVWHPGGNAHAHAALLSDVPHDDSHVHVSLGYDLGAGLTGCNGGIDERPREEGFFASLSPPFPGKTEATRGLD